MVMKAFHGIALLVYTLTLPSLSFALINTTQKQNSTPSTSTSEDTQYNAFSTAPKMLQKRFIVKYKNTRSNSDTSISPKVMSNMTLMRSQAIKSSTRQIFNMEATDFQAFNEMRNALQQDPNVEYVEEDTFIRPLNEPNDALYEAQWSLHQDVTGIDADEAWQLSTGVGAIVAVLDTGYTDHNDYNASLINTGYDFISDPEIAIDGNGRDSDAFDEGDADPDNDCGFGESNSSWHGSHVAGIVAASADNRLGIAGVAYDAQVLPIRVIGKCGGFSSDIADAIRWAAGGSVDGIPNNTAPAQVINLSLGGRGICNTITQEAIDFALDQGSTVIVAAGNEATEAATSTPANCDGVITVAATNRAGERANYSNFGEIVDIAAPGGEIINNPRDGILSAVNQGDTSPEGDSFAYYIGTSMAAPHVAGVAALLYSLNPNLTGKMVERLLKASITPFPSECEGCGVGIVNANAAVSLLTVGSTPLPEEPEEVEEDRLSDITPPRERENPRPIPTPNESRDRRENQPDQQLRPSNSGGGAISLYALCSLLLMGILSRSFHFSHHSRRTE